MLNTGLHHITLSDRLLGSLRIGVAFLVDHDKECEQMRRSC
jgi:hypothetical protein